MAFPARRYSRFNPARKYVVVRIPNTDARGRTRVTYDVIRNDAVGLSHVAECGRRAHALLLASALNAGARR